MNLNPNDEWPNQHCERSILHSTALGAASFRQLATLSTLTKLHFIGAKQCLYRDRFVTQLCLLVWSGGTPVLLAYPQVTSFSPG